MKVFNPIRGNTTKVVTVLPQRPSTVHTTRPPSSSVALPQRPSSGSSRPRGPRKYASTPSITISLGSNLLSIDSKTRQLLIKRPEDNKEIPVVATNKSTREDFIVGNHPNGGDINSKDLYKYYRIEQDQNYKDNAVFYQGPIKVKGPDPNWTPVQVNFDYRLIGGVVFGGYYYPSAAHQDIEKNIGRAGAHYIWRAQSNMATPQLIIPHEVRRPTLASIAANPRKTTPRQQSMLQRAQTDSTLRLMPQTMDPLQMKKRRRTGTIQLPSNVPRQ